MTTTQKIALVTGATRATAAALELQGEGLPVEALTRDVTDAASITAAVDTVQARIVNVSSLLGSIALHSQPGSPIYDFKVPAYNVSKSVVNAWTVQLAYELRDTPIKVNTIHPGYVKTDMNSGEGELEVADGARNSVMMALLDADGATGSYTHVSQVLPW